MDGAAAAPAPAPAAAERSVQVVPAKGMGPPGAPPVMCRQFGTVDIDGNGTTLNMPDGTPLTNAGPFVLLDVVTMADIDNFKAPFCAHPHSGAAVCSVLMEGNEFRAWDNLRGAEADPLTPVSPLASPDGSSKTRVGTYIAINSSSRKNGQLMCNWQ